jgi:hypothetical protein
MSDDKNAQPPIAGGAGLPKQKSPHFRVIYSNIFQYRVTLTDVSLIFSTLADVGEPPGGLVQTQEVGVIMALGQVKNLAEYLSMIISRYEREIGPIASVGKDLPSEAEVDGMFKILKDIGTH